jgi:hypothetical protein
MIQEKYGWLLPDGTIHECGQYGHDVIAMAVFVDPDFQEQQQEVRDDYQYRQDTKDVGQHPAWHVYENKLEHVVSNARYRLYAIGALRYGTFTSNLDGQRRMEFEGRSEAVEALRTAATLFALEHDCTPTFSIQ